MGPKILAPGITQFDFPKKTALEILNLAKNIEQDKWDSSGIYSDQDLSSPLLRVSYSLPVSFLGEDIFKKIKSSIKMCTDIYKNIYGVNFDNCENLDILKYKEGGYFTPHIDTGSSRYRTVSLLIYLNPLDYEGGETNFNHFKIDIKPSEPAIVLFPSNYPYLHSAKTVLSGEKYVIVGWFNDLATTTH
jgi:hypothetical protein